LLVVLSKGGKMQHRLQLKRQPNQFEESME
jgi:hypothetical protein